MADADIRTETALAASPDPDEADDAILSALIELGLTKARAFQAEAIAALQADDLDRAGKAEGHFSRLFLGIRRAIALRARLRQQREEARRGAEQDRDDRLAQAADRRRRVAQGVTESIAAATPTPAEAPTRERLIADLWERLAGDHADRPDTADRALSIEALIRSLCRTLGIPPDRAAIAAAIAGTAEADGGAGVETAGHAPAQGWFRPADAPIAHWPPPRPPGLDSG